MNLDTVKVELIDWIAQLDDPEAIGQLLTFKEERSSTKNNYYTQKKFGSGKFLVEYIADDFNDTPSIFKDYLK